MLKRIIPFGHSLLEELISKKDITIDATVGNGNDTLLLSKLSKHVYGFDIQEQAINNAKKLLTDNNVTNVTLFQDGHQNLRDYVKVNVKAIVFNLGYLPGGDKTIVSKAETTILAIKNGLEILDFNGIILLTLYIGHVGGKQESLEIEDFVSSLDSEEHQVLKYQFMNKKNAPYVIVIQKTL